MGGGWKWRGRWFGGLEVVGARDYVGGGKKVDMI